MNNNPLAARLLIWTSRHRRRLNPLHRLVCIALGSDVWCELPAGIQLPHPYGVILHSGVRVGAGTVLMQQVTLGQKSLMDAAVPEVGRDCYIGAGAKLLGAIRVGDRVTVGANAVVTVDVPDDATVVGYNRIVG